MATQPWKVPSDVADLIEAVKQKYHLPRLEDAKIVACFEDSKPFTKNKPNLGKVVKFTPLAKLWHSSDSCDFCVVICADFWHDVLTSKDQREALADLLLSRCDVEYIPETITENGKKKTIKDDWGRVKYTNEIKVDKVGQPVWRISPLDLEVYTSNIRRFGFWFEEFRNLQSAVETASKEAA